MAEMEVGRRWIYKIIIGKVDFNFCKPLIASRRYKGSFTRAFSCPVLAKKTNHKKLLKRFITVDTKYSFAWHDWTNKSHRSMAPLNDILEFLPSKMFQNRPLHTFQVVLNLSNQNSKNIFLIFRRHRRGAIFLQIWIGIALEQWSSSGQSDQIRRFLKVLGDMVSVKSSQNAWWIFGLK